MVMYRVEYYITQKESSTNDTDKLSDYAVQEKNKNIQIEALDLNTRCCLTEQGLSAFYGEKIMIKADEGAQK